jgi:hypothetical protein
MKTVESNFCDFDSNKIMEKYEELREWDSETKWTEMCAKNGGNVAWRVFEAIFQPFCGKII